MKEILVFDVGENIVGMIDLNTDTYSHYRGPRMVDGARRILDCQGIVISFNGSTGFDRQTLATLVGIANPAALSFRGTHYDMQDEASRDRWPPEPGTDPILGQNLQETYWNYFRDSPPDPPDYLDDDYERDNWSDCYMAAALWRRIVLQQQST